MGRGFWEKHPNVNYRDFVLSTVFTNSLSPSTSSSNPPSGTPYPLAHYIKCDNFSVNYQKFIAAVITDKEPKSFKEAMQSVEWRNSMKQEIQALEDNGTWSLEPLPPGKRALGC